MHYDLIAQARRLANASRQRPRQVDLRRAISTAYYACFHALAKSNADMLVGSVSANRIDDAWSQAYRALEHGFARTACQKLAAGNFSADVVNFGLEFSNLQSDRHLADYDPDIRYLRSDVILKINVAETAIRGLLGVPAAERRAFAIHVTMKKR